MTAVSGSTTTHGYYCFPENIFLLHPGNVLLDTEIFFSTNAVFPKDVNSTGVPRHFLAR